jgi:hypothetical protein
MDLESIEEKVQEKIDKSILEYSENNTKKTEKRGVIDVIQEKIVSRKLLVFAAATSLFVWYGLAADTWGMIAMCYIGGQSAIDFAKVWRG